MRLLFRVVFIFIFGYFSNCFGGILISEGYIYGSQVSDGIALITENDSIELYEYAFGKDLEVYYDERIKENPFSNISNIISVDVHHEEISFLYYDEGILKYGKYYLTEAKDDDRFNETVVIQRRDLELSSQRNNPFTLLDESPFGPIIADSAGNASLLDIVEGNLINIGNIPVGAIAMSSGSFLTGEEDEDGFSVFDGKLCIVYTENSKAYIRILPIEANLEDEKIELSIRKEDLEYEISLDDYFLSADNITVSNIEFNICLLPESDDEFDDMFILHLKNKEEKNEFRIFVYKQDEVWKSHIDNIEPYNDITILDNDVTVVEEVSNGEEEFLDIDLIISMYGYSSNKTLYNNHHFGFGNFKLEFLGCVGIYPNVPDFDDSILVGVVHGPPPNHINEDFEGVFDLNRLMNKVDLSFSSSVSELDNWSWNVPAGGLFSKDKTTEYALGAWMKIQVFFIESTAKMQWGGSDSSSFKGDLEAQYYFTWDSRGDQGYLVFMGGTKYDARQVSLSGNNKTRDDIRKIRNTYIPDWSYWITSYDMLNPDADQYKEYLKGMEPAPGRSNMPEQWDPNHTDFCSESEADEATVMNPALPEYSKYRVYQKYFWQGGTGEQNFSITFKQLTSLLSGTKIGGSLDTAFTTLGTERDALYGFGTSDIQLVRVKWGGQFMPEKYTIQPFNLRIYFIQCPEDDDEAKKLGVWNSDYYHDRGYRPWLLTYRSEML